MRFPGVTPKVKRWLRFGIGGGMNTGLSYLIYLLSGLIFDYQIAFFLGYISGIVFSYWYNTRYVFRVPFKWSGFLAYPLVYIVQYALSALLLAGAIEYFGIEKSIAPLAIAAITVPLTYCLSKFFLGLKEDAISRSSR
ncbi:GtrA family protein [Paracidovorax avenae]|uniref:GtrA family protein n=1 Tax=Paracidovorax avenae TaxID=80867 RepID=UPI000D1749A7|nr:GtrA family protein [Paracidovorax avenae]AVT15476.1 GtrA family protein [Paracidovorax avenae]